jgi:hypothetical protein
MIQMAKDMALDAEQAAKLGLNADELPSIARALIQNESAVKELGDSNARISQIRHRTASRINHTIGKRESV